jgi:hypothetical protein
LRESDQANDEQLSSHAAGIHSSDCWRKWKYLTATRQGIILGYTRDMVNPSKPGQPRPDADRPSHPMGASLLVVGGVTLLIIVLAVLSVY